MNPSNPYQSLQHKTGLLVIAMLAYGILMAQKPTEVKPVELIPHPQDSVIDVYIDGRPFTSYRYTQKLEKPVLYPIVSAHGKSITRGFPLEPRPGERIDHPHHVGLWFNYGDVNGLDFWNNSSAIASDQLIHYGKIFHDAYQIVEDQEGPALKVQCTWKDHAGQALLKESTIFRFKKDRDAYVIDRLTTLEALQEVSFEDNKEGVLGMRVARELEMPSNKPDLFTDAQGNVTAIKVLDNSNVTGDYLSSEGLKGDAVWGTRGRWVRLAGTMEGMPVSIAIIDHPDNVGYPTYWHARGYGLFAANPLGQAIFSEGKEALHFKLSKGESTTFKYRIVIQDNREMTPQQIEQFVIDFTN